jgi:transposase
MPKSTFGDIPQEEHRQRLAVLRRARYGYRLALHILLVCAAGRTPPTIAAVLFCSRSSVYRTVHAYRTGKLSWEHDAQGRLLLPVRTTVLLPTLRRSLLALLKTPPRAYGWCRTRWSGATLALTLAAKRGLKVSAETLRRWLHEVGWVWKRAQLVAKDDDPHRVERLARIRFISEQLRLWEALVVADELDLQLLPKIGAAWMPKGTQVEVMTPGTKEKHSLAGALELASGTLHRYLGPRKTKALFRELWPRLDGAYPATYDKRVYVVADNDKIHKAKAVGHWLAAHPRVARLLLPTYCPRANPIERACGDVHDLCTRTHTRKRLLDRVADVVEPLDVNGPWPYKLSDIYYDPALTAAVEHMTMEQPLAAAG